ncbi:MAG: oligosaccharide flippase family protein [Desulfuromonadaceae bacterium]|nr:oligosaccharide flippase family protein [Desulfuromonas sp.]MDY0185173.1 oligosaccharide flippase family protein [Desulfuromonadaceae bacterium]
MSGTRSQLGNLAINWGGHALALVVMFFLSPYVIGKLDAVNYGIWSLLSVLAGYMGLFDIGVRGSVGRHIALYLGKKDRVGVDETIRAGFGIFTITGCLILLAGVLLGWLFPVLFKGVSSEHYSTVRYLLPLMVVNIWFSVVAAIYSSVLTAHDRFDIARSIDMLALLMRTMATVYTLHIGWGLWGLAGAIILANVFALVANRIAAGIIYEGLRSFPFLFSRTRMKELFGYGVFSFISSVAVKVIGQSDLVIVGAVLSVASVREYSVGAMLVYYSAPFISMISGTFFPAVQRKVASGARQEVQHLLYKQLKISMCFGLLAYIGLAFYSHTFIRLWMLQDGFDLTSVAEAATVMTILALSKLPSLYLIPCQSVLNAMGHVRFNAMRAITEASVNLMLSLFFVLALGWGLAGVAAGTLVARLLVASISVPVFLSRRMSFSLQTFLTKVILPGAVAAGCFALVCLGLINLWPMATWVDFVMQVGSAVAVWCVIALFLLLPKENRVGMKNTLFRCFAKKSEL